MLISEKQHEANIRNAQQSTGPQTPEGKQAVRFNALKHGLRAAVTLLPFEDAEQFNQLCEKLEADWRPQNESERIHVEQMAVHQWLLRRLANFEAGVFASPMGADKQMAILERFSTQRNRLERSFSHTMHDLIELQKHRQAGERHARSGNQVPTKPQPPIAMPAPASDPGYSYTMSTDTR